MTDPANLQIIAAALALTVLWTLEAVIPFAVSRQRHLGHSVRNVSIGIFNSILLAILFVPVFAGAAEWSRLNRFGLLNLLDLPVWLSFPAAVILLDGWMYVWHRANHRLPLLWRFHKVHHSDPEMDASTAVRFHTGEILISAGLRIGVIAVFGLSLPHLLLYDLLLVPFIVLHHSNIKFPEKLDGFYRLMFASPAMHRIHHSPLRTETDSNYGSLFSFWDRLAGSFRPQRQTAAGTYGLDEFFGINTERFSFLLLMPFQKESRKS